MAEYTISIREILQMHKQPGQDLQNPADVLSIGQSYIFDHAPINVINTNYREKFMTGFLLHFFNEEIGLETIPLWKIALNEKIINNAEYINLVFDNIDKQLFAEYKVKTLNTATNSSSEATETGRGSKTTSNSSEEEGSISEEHSDTNTKTGDNSKTLNSTKTGGGTVADAKTGTDTTTETGTVTNSKAGSENNVKTGTDTLASTGTDTTTNSGEDIFTPEGVKVVSHKGEDTTLDRSAEITTGLGGKVTENLNVVDIHSDTPMGSLDNLRTPGGNAAGLGVTYQTGSSQQGGQTYNYMTDASERGQTITREDVSKSQVERGYYLDSSGNMHSDDGVTNQYDSSQIESFAERDSNGHVIVGTERKDTTAYGKITETEKGTTDTRTYNVTDAKTFNNYLETETRNTQSALGYNSTNTQTRNTTDTEQTTNRDVISEEDVNEGTSATSNSKSVTNTGSESTTDNKTTANEGEVTNTGTITDTTLNWEMIYKSMPLLNKVWELFDDIFMLIF